MAEVAESELTLDEQLLALPEHVRAMLMHVHDVLDRMPDEDLHGLASGARAARRESPSKYADALASVAGVASAMLLYERRRSGS